MKQICSKAKHFTRLLFLSLLMIFTMESLKFFVNFLNFYIILVKPKNKSSTLGKLTSKQLKTLVFKNLSTFDESIRNHKLWYKSKIKPRLQIDKHVSTSHTRAFKTLNLSKSTFERFFFFFGLAEIFNSWFPIYNPFYLTIQPNSPY